MRDLFVGSIFIPFVPSQSIEAYNRPRGQSERRDTLICQCLLAVLRAFIVRLFKGADFYTRFFSTFRFFCSSTRGGKIHRDRRKWEKQRTREKQKQIRNSFNLGSGVWQHVVGCHDTLIPQFFVPYAILQFYGLFYASWWYIIMIVSTARFWKRHVKIKLDLSE